MGFLVAKIRGVMGKSIKKVRNGESLAGRWYLLNVTMVKPGQNIGHKSQVEAEI